MRLAVDCMMEDSLMDNGLTAVLQRAHMKEDNRQQHALGTERFNCGVRD